MSKMTVPFMVVLLALSVMAGQGVAFAQYANNEQETTFVAEVPLLNCDGAPCIEARIGEGKAVRLVFSENTKRGLRSGDLAMPTDKSSGLRRAEARDGAGRIREGARFQELDKWERLSHGLVAVARVISALDVETQIERLILPRFGGHHSEGVDGVHGGAEEAAYSPQIH